MKEIIHAIECVRQIKQTTNELTPDILKILRQQEKVNELTKEHMQLSYDFEYMLVHGIKDDIKYTKTANRLLTVREKLQEILNWKGIK